jgi:hypothetical protein
MHRLLALTLFLLNLASAIAFLLATLNASPAVTGRDLRQHSSSTF